MRRCPLGFRNSVVLEFRREIRTQETKGSHPHKKNHQKKAWTSISGMGVRTWSGKTGRGSDLIPLTHVICVYHISLTQNDIDF